MRSFVRAATLAAAVGLSALTTFSHADTETGYLYISDYGNQALDRFSYSYDTVTHVISHWQAAGAGGSTTPALFINANVKEGLQGTANDIIVVDTGGNSLSRYTLNGQFIGTISIKNANGTVHNLNSVGNVQITPDGKYMYAPESAGGVIDKIDLATGKIVASAVFAGAHDVLIKPNGDVIAAAYTGSNGQSSGLWQFDADLTSGSKVQLAVDQSNGLSRPTGMSLSKDGSTLYVQDNIQGANGGISTYSVDPVTGALTFVKKITNANLDFDFGTDIGPDGKVYIAALGGGETHANFPHAPGYVNGVYSYDPTTDGVALAVAGYNTGTSLPNLDFYSPKYLEFGKNFITANDAGYDGTPEPGSLALVAGLMTAGGAFSLSRRRRKV